MRLKAQSKNEKENFLPEVLFLMFCRLALINKIFMRILKFRSSLFKGLHEPPVPAGIDTYAEHVCRRRRDRASAPQSAKSL